MKCGAREVYPSRGSFRTTLLREVHWVVIDHGKEIEEDNGQSGEGDLGCDVGVGQMSYWGWFGTHTVLGATDSGHSVTNHVQNGFKTYLERIDLRQQIQYPRLNFNRSLHLLIDTLVRVFFQVFEGLLRDVAHGYSLMVRPGIRDVSCAYRAEEGVVDLPLVRIRIQKSSDARVYVNDFLPSLASRPESRYNTPHPK